MKFFGKKSLSSILYWLCSICVVALTLLLLFIILSLIFKNYAISGTNEFSMEIPLTNSYIKSDYTQITLTFLMTSMIIFFIYYGIFFYLLRLIFKAFSMEKVIFTKKTLGYIRNFAQLNIFLPPLGIIAAYFIKNGIDFEAIMQGGLLVLLGVFSLFVVAVFKEGIVLQEETDLTI